MNDLEKQLNNLGREINAAYVLKKSERARVLSQVIEQGHVPEAMPSPYHVIHFPHAMFMNRASLFLLVTFLCTGVLSYSAETALPGDPLYAVKTQFNENFQSFLTFSPESKAKLEATLAEKRLVEIQKLTVSDRLSLDSKTELQEDFKKHSDSFKKSIQEIGVKDPGAAISLSSDFQVTLATHKDALDALNGVASSTMVELADLRKEAEKSLSNLSVEEIKILAEEQATSTQLLFENIISVASSSNVVIDVDILNTIKTLQEKGISELSEQKYVEAYLSFMQAFGVLKSLNISIQSSVVESNTTDDSIASSTVATSTTATSTETASTSSTQ